MTNTFETPEAEREAAYRLSKQTGYSIYECRKALFIADGDLERAIEYLAKADWKKQRNELRSTEYGYAYLDDVVEK